MGAGNPYRYAGGEMSLYPFSDGSVEYPEAVAPEPSCPQCGTATDRNPGEHWVLLDGGKRVCTSHWHNPNSFERRALAADKDHARK